MCNETIFICFEQSNLYCTFWIIFFKMYDHDIHTYIRVYLPDTIICLWLLYYNCTMQYYVVAEIVHESFQWLTIWKFPFPNFKRFQFRMFVGEFDNVLLTRFYVLSCSDFPVVYMFGHKIANVWSKMLVKTYIWCDVTYHLLKVSCMHV